MTKQETISTSTKDRELTITRLLNAPRELVFKVWTDPDHLAQWWGPTGFTNTIEKMDLRPGGVWQFVMHGPDGTDFKNKCIFVEIDEPELIVFDHISGPKFRAIAIFDAEGNQTRLTWRMVFQTEEEKSNTINVFKADEGLKQNVVRLEHYLANLSQ